MSGEVGEPDAHLNVAEASESVVLFRLSLLDLCRGQDAAPSEHAQVQETGTPEATEFILSDLPSFSLDL